MNSPLMVPSEKCDGCPAYPGLFIVTLGGRYCAVCWNALPEPAKWLAPPKSIRQVHEAELATRERMTARGGTDRHLVRNGKS